jgi:hypothetical protein
VLQYECYICTCHALYFSSCVSLTCRHSPSALNLSLSLWIYRIVWVETGVLESEEIPTSCNLFHNQDLYKYSTLPLPRCQIVASAHFVRSDSGPCRQSCLPCPYSPWRTLSSWFTATYPSSCWPTPHLPLAFQYIPWLPYPCLLVWVCAWVQLAPPRLTMRLVSGCFTLLCCDGVEFSIKSICLKWKPT